MSRDTTLDAERRASPPGDFETAIARQCRSPVEAPPLPTTGVRGRPYRPR